MMSVKPTCNRQKGSAKTGVEKAAGILIGSPLTAANYCMIWGLVLPIFHFNPRGIMIDYQT